MVVDAVIAIGGDDRLNLIGIKKVNAYACIASVVILHCLIVGISCNNWHFFINSLGMHVFLKLCRFECDVKHC